MYVLCAVWVYGFASANVIFLEGFSSFILYRKSQFDIDLIEAEKLFDDFIMFGQ